MIYLDTNVVVWLAANAFEQISQTAQDVIENSDDLCVSPMVSLELQYLHDTKKISHKPEFILKHLSQGIGLKVCEKPFIEIIDKAKTLNWTRDPFDRIITAHAALMGDVLLSKDTAIRKNYRHTIW